VKQFLLALYRRTPWRALDRWLGYSERRRLLDRALEAQRPHMHGRVLEIGAGEDRRRGCFIPPVEDADLWLTLDLDPAARPHVIANLLRLPLPPGAFDAALCLEMIEYVDDPLQALAELRRALAPGGALIMSVPFMHHADAPSDRWRLTGSGWRMLLDRAGFEVLELHSQGGALSAAAHTLKWAIHALPRGVPRIAVAALMWLPVSLWRWLDAPSARRYYLLRAASTGYLIRARRVG
jgi:SAM-dependent methyltransferase